MNRTNITRRVALKLGGVLLAGVGAEVLGACTTETAPAAARPIRTESPDIAGTFDLFKLVTPKLTTLEQELALPEAIFAAARREGKVTFISAIDKEPIQKLFAAFKKRHPGIEPTHQEASSEEVRTVRTLTEFKAGRNRIDVLMGIGGFLGEYKAAKALTRLDDLPAFANYGSPLSDPETEWAPTRIQFWGIGYNADKVKSGDLPRTWEDLGSPTWRGRIGLGDRPQLWVQMLWKLWGPDRTTAFLKALFANAPQRRKENLDAAANLLGAGEFDLFVPASTARIQGLAEKGVPVSWSSPEPLTVSTSEMLILPRSPNPNAAKVFVNWFISREGQDVYAKADFIVPPHPALRSQREYLGTFADAIIGKRAAVRAPEDEQTVLTEVRKVWNDLWIA